MDDSSRETARVKIFDRVYNVRSEKDAAYIASLAEYVDGRMREIASGTTTVDTLRVAILAALNVADDYFQLKQKFAEADRTIGQKALSCVDVLDEILN